MTQTHDAHPTTLYDAIFLAPHLDDAALSCGGQIAGLTRAGRRVLVNGAPSRQTAAQFEAEVVLRQLETDIVATFADDGPVETGGMVGLCFWWPGIGTPTTPGADVQKSAQRRQEGHGVPKMCSHMAGVLPAWQGTGVGLQLKLAQREAILAQGFTDWVTWTYDPLLRTNAVFNIRRLGAVCSTYKSNWYGVMLDGLNAGTPSDRCQVDWWLNSQRVTGRVAGEAGRRDATKHTALPAELQIMPTVPATAKTPSFCTSFCAASTAFFGS